jgi:N-acetylglucosamine-6-phosphate deacetylase
VTVLANTRVVTPRGVLDPGWVSVANGRIADVGTGTAPVGARVDLRGAFLLPGFVDLHVHGGAGTTRRPRRRTWPGRSRTTVHPALPARSSRQASPAK